VCAIELANGISGVDLVVVARGGGSIEDLWTFNEEAVARAIAGSRVPVVSAIGHETDVTIADLVADLRAPTPSAAAEMILPDQAEVGMELDRRADRLARALDSRAKTAQLRLDRLVDRLLRAPGDVVERAGRRLEQYELRLAPLIRGVLDRGHRRLGERAAGLEALSPLSVLGRGYSLAFVDRGGHATLVRDAADCVAGETLTTRLARGVLRSRIEAVNEP
jgi:exodeoxyribonuclease VII large subunit